MKLIQSGDVDSAIGKIKEWYPALLQASIWSRAASVVLDICLYFFFVPSHVDYCVSRWKVD